MNRACETVFLRALAPAALALSAILPPAVGAEEAATVSGATVIVVRHAEKVDDSRDPTLSEAGVERAEALAEALAHVGLDAAYASQYRRTQSTATPAANDAGLPVIVDPIEGDIDAWAQGFATELTQNHTGETVLVAGHSNTVPPLVAVLCGCSVEPLTDSDYDRIYLVTGAGTGHADLVVARYGRAGKESD